MLAGYEHSLTWALQHSRFVLFIFFGAIVLNVVLFAIVPKGFFPGGGHRTPDRLAAGRSKRLIPADDAKATADDGHRAADPAVEHVVGYTGVGSGGGFGQINTGSVFVSLKPIDQRPSDGTGDRAVAAETGQGARRPTLSLRRPGHPRRRPTKQRAISIHAAGRRSGPAIQMDGVTRQCARTLQGHGRRQLRSAATRPGIRSGYRPADRLAARHHAGTDRQYAVRRLRAAPSFRHLQRDQSISRRHGDRSALYAISDVTARYLRGDVRRRRVGNAAIERARGRRYPPAKPRPTIKRRAQPQRPMPTTIRRAMPPSTRWPIPAEAPHHRAPRCRPRWRPWCRLPR